MNRSTEEFVNDLNRKQQVGVEYFLTTGKRKHVFAKKSEQLLQDKILCATVRLDPDFFSKKIENPEIQTFVLIKEQATPDVIELFQSKAQQHDCLKSKGLKWSSRMKKDPMRELFVLVQNFERIVTSNRFYFLQSQVAQDVQKMIRKITESKKKTIPGTSLDQYVKEMVSCKSTLGLELLQAYLAQKDFRPDDRKLAQIWGYLLCESEIDIQQRNSADEQIFQDLRRFKKKLKKMASDATYNGDKMISCFVFERGKAASQQMKSVLEYQQRNEWGSADTAIGFMRRAHAFRLILSGSSRIRDNFLKLVKQALSSKSSSLSVTDFALLTLLIELADAKGQRPRLHDKLKAKGIRLRSPAEFDFAVWLAFYLSFNATRQSEALLDAPNLAGFLQKLEDCFAESDEDRQKKFKLVRKWIAAVVGDSAKTPRPVAGLLRSEETLLFAFLLAQQRQKSSLFMEQLRDFVNAEAEGASPSVTCWLWVLYPFRAFWSTKRIKSSVSFPYFENLYAHFLTKENKQDNSHFLKRFDWAREDLKVDPGDVLLNHNSLDRLSVVFKSLELVETREHSDLHRVDMQGGSDLTEAQHKRVRRNLSEFVSTAENSLLEKLSRDARIFRFVFNGTERSFAKRFITRKYFQRFLRSSDSAKWSSYIVDYFFQPAKGRR